MFKLLEKMNLDYVLNSQVLWGDYETVKELAICELTKDREDDIVVVKRFQWNGKSYSFRMRYGDKLKFWRFSVEDYLKII